MATSLARIAAVICVALTNVVLFAFPLKLTVEPLTKFVPFTVRVNPFEPAAMVDGEIVVIVGTGFCAAVIVNVTELDVPPPGVGFVTVTAGVPVDVTSLARIDAVSCVALTNVVVFALPLNFTVEPFTKFVPFTVSVNAAEPAAIVDGEIVVTVGTGFDAAVIVNVTEFDVPPPGVGFVTVTAGVPAVATSLARIDAVSCVALTNVVVFAVPLNFTTELLTKFVPFTVSVRAPDPAATVDGESVVTVGPGFVPLVIVNATAFEIPPPGVGFVTVTGGVPADATSVARIAAVSCVALTNVVALALPLKFTTELLMKFEPFTVNVNAPDPAAALEGCSVVIAGTGFDVPTPS
jgi:hypothetical protein